MTASVAFNYLPTTNGAGGFNATSVGYVQGMFIDDPAVRYQLAGGVLATTETLPMWGGVAISEAMLPNASYTNPVTGTVETSPDSTLGGLITRATGIATGTGSLTGFSVFNQAYGMVITPQSSVPLSGSSMQVNFFRMGSNARIVVACASSISGIEGDPVNTPVSWDYVNQQLVPYVPAYAAANTTAVAYNSTTGVLSLTFAVAPFGASAADLYDGTYVSISGITGVGAGVASLAGDFPVVTTTTSGTIIEVQCPTGLTAGTFGATSGALRAGGGALSVKVLEVLIGNTMTVNYASTTGFASWNYSGSVALIQV